MHTTFLCAEAQYKVIKKTIIENVYLIFQILLRTIYCNNLQLQAPEQAYCGLSEVCYLMILLIAKILQRRW